MPKTQIRTKTQSGTKVMVALALTAGIVAAAAAGFTTQKNSQQQSARRALARTQSEQQGELVALDPDINIRDSKSVSNPSFTKLGDFFWNPNFPTCYLQDQPFSFLMSEDVQDRTYDDFPSEFGVFIYRQRDNPDLYPVAESVYDFDNLSDLISENLMEGYFRDENMIKNIIFSLYQYSSMEDIPYVSDIRVLDAEYQSDEPWDIHWLVDYNRFSEDRPNTFIVLLEQKSPIRFEVQIDHNDGREFQAEIFIENIQFQMHVPVTVEGNIDFSRSSVQTREDVFIGAAQEYFQYSGPLDSYTDAIFVPPEVQPLRWGETHRVEDDGTLTDITSPDIILLLLQLSSIDLEFPYWYFIPSDEIWSDDVRTDFIRKTAEVISVFYAREELVHLESFTNTETLQQHHIQHYGSDEAQVMVCDTHPVMRQYTYPFTFISEAVTSGVSVEWLRNGETCTSDNNTGACAITITDY